MTFDFTTLPDRRQTGSLKWEHYGQRDVLPMWVADMDFRSSPAIMDALHRRVDHGVYGYTEPPPETVEATLAYLQRVHQIEVDASALIYTPGLVPALNVLSLGLLAPDEEVLTCTPVYGPFLTAPEYQNRPLISVPLREDNGLWSFDMEALEATVTPHTRMLILCHPHNPVGRAWTKEELTEIAAFCEKHDLILASDEIHCDLILEPGREHLTMLRPEFGVQERTIGMFAPSKTYNLPGLACAFLLIPEVKLRTRVKRAMRGLLTEVNCLGYAGCAAAYNHGEPWRQELLSVLRSNRDYLIESVRTRMQPLKIWPVEATYLAWIDARGLGLKDPTRFFEEHGVGLSGGEFFGAPGFVRVNFGTPRNRLEEAAERMVKAVASVTKGDRIDQ